MPFCSNCGSQIKEESKFCNVCGAPVDDQQFLSKNSGLTSINQHEITRKDSLDEMNRLITYFGKKQSKYDEYDKCVEQIEYYSNPGTVVQVDEAGFQYGGGTGKGQKVGGAWMLGAAVVFFLMTLVAGGIRSNTGVKLLIVSIALLAGGIVLLVVGNKKSDAYNDAYNLYRKNRSSKQKAEKERLLKHYKERYNQLGEDLSNYYENYGYCPVAASYTNPRILREIRKPIEMGRADTIKEAMNLLVQDAHNAEMEAQAAATAQSASMAAQSAANAARGAKVAAFFTAASFINDLRK